MVIPPHHMTSMQENRGDRSWDILCLWCISMTFLMMHIPAYKHLTSSIGLRWQQSWRRNYIVVADIIKCNQHLTAVLTATVRATRFVWWWMISSYLSVLVSVFLDLFLHLGWIGKLMSSLMQNRHHKELGLFFDLRDTLHLRPLCISIKPPSAHVWSTAQIFGVVLHIRVAVICLIGSRGGWSI